MTSDHPFLNLNLGLIKENYAVVKRTDKKLWEDRGFKQIHTYPIFGYLPNPLKIIMLGVPSMIEEFGIDELKNSKIIDVTTIGGTYGMGGPGFFELKLQGEYGIRLLTYCIWSAGEHILYDGKVLECHLNYSKKYKPIISSDDYSNTLAAFRDTLSGMTIRDIVLLKESIEIVLVDSNNEVHSIKSFISSEKFPEQGGTQVKRKSFDTGEMKDYWFVTYDETVLKV